MRKTRSVASLITVALTIAACSGVGDYSTEPFSGSAVGMANSAKAAGPRPAGGTCITDIDIVATRPGAVFSIDMTGVCLLWHLGLTTMVITQDIFPNGSATNSTTYTSSNGDLLYSTWYSAPGDNSFVNGHAVFTGTETYAGGTGRFAAATGSSTVTGTADLNFSTGAFAGEYTSTGTITY